MKRNSEQLTYRDRIILERMLRDGVSVSGIAVILARHRNTISYEFAQKNMNAHNYSALTSQLRVR